ncbi:hypothetical protein HDU98_012100 [Podochytrium sp. JEL0797]|nr:hypothetical protein HDU98_012100 [Podochytrium sp. JEL0797]
MGQAALIAGCTAALVLIPATWLVLSTLGKPAKQDHPAGPPKPNWLQSVATWIAVVQRKSHEQSVALFEALGPIYQVNRFGTVWVVVGDTAAIQRILTSDKFVRGDVFFKNAQDLMPHALFGLPTNDAWKRHRKAIVKALNPQFVRTAFENTSLLSNRLIQLWNDKLSTRESIQLDLQECLASLTHDVLLLTLSGRRDIEFSESFDAGASGEKGVEMKMKAFLRAFFLRAVAPKAFYGLLGIRPTQLMGLKAYLSEMADAFIQGGPENNELLTVMLAVDEDGNRIFSDDEVKDQVLGLLVAGHETTSSTITNVLLALTQDDRVMKLLRSEIDALEPIEDGEFSIKQISEMPYLENVLREAQRLYPAVSATSPRTNLETVQLMGYTFQAGTLFLPSMKGAMLHPDTYGPNPTSFFPERFDALPDMDSSTFMPFGAGIHKCPGSKLAVVEAKLILVKLLKVFEFELVPNQSLSHVIGFTVSLKDGLLINISKRN